jgi:diacylglycerol kinase family enzyme
MTNEEAKPGQAARVALVYSPHAGAARREHPAATLRAAGLDVIEELAITEMAAQDYATTLARWHAAGAQAIVAAGGDGTVGAVGGLAAQTNLPLGVLPLGTANDIARALELPAQAEAASRLIAQLLSSGAERLIDAGELANLDGTPSGYFLHALTLGLNVEFARRATNAQLRQRWGKLTYLVSAATSLTHFTPLSVTLSITEMEGAPAGEMTTINAQIALLVALNLPIFGGWMELRAPAVRDGDRLLDFFLLEAPHINGVSDIITALEKLVDGLVERGGMGIPREQVAFPGARWFRARAVAITTPEPAQITLDGELRGVTPATVRVAAQPARILAPQPTRI